MVEEAVDSAALVAEIQAEVTGKRARGEYPQELLDRLDTEFHPTDMSLPPEALAPIQSVRPIVSKRPVIGPIVTFCKKVMRRCLFWYVHPITVDQTRFNIAASRELRSMERRIAELERQVGKPDSH
jgi:hypothetical protein